MTAEEIFLAVVEKATPAERAAYMQIACGADEALRAEVEKLLQSHEQAGSFLNQPLFDPPPTIDQPAAAERLGMRIGPYKLLQQIGEGGMGAVYMAEQTHPVQRKVALKLIKPGLDSRQIIARFEAERQALALMDHPNIAKVLDAGTTEAGRPYFVMELVKGIPITQYCDEHQLTPRERLGLFQQVCQAAQHAHHKGIIHRDLKPTNVLVAEYDQHAIPKIIDFGVAKAIGQRLTERTMFTEFGQLVGTVEYMSPEQAKLNQLDIDTRTDVYSLGVLLYELLTGETPLDRQKLRSAAFDEILRIIREEEPPKPSTRLSTADKLPSIAANRHTEPQKLTMLIRGELDWIVMKALEKDRNRRYETANGLGMDIQRYLNDEHVLACPPSAGYRLRKFARRNKAEFATAGLVAVALLVGTMVSTWHAIRATKAEGLAQQRLEAETKARTDADAAREEAETARKDAEAARDREKGLRREADDQRQRAETALVEVEQQKRQAEANFDKARRAVDEYLTQVTESELLSVPGLQPLREDLLEAALRFYTEFTQERSLDLSLRRDLAAAQHRLSLIQRELGNTEAFKTANAEAIRLFEELRAQDPMALEVKVGLVRANFAVSRGDDTVKLCQDVLQSDPQHAEVRSLLAETHNTRGVEASLAKKYDDALKHHQQAFELREALVREFPDKAEYLAQLGVTVNNLGVLLSRQGKGAEALAMYERGVEYKTQAYERAPHSILWGHWLCLGLRNVAQKKLEFGQQEEALQVYERLVAVSRKRAFENPAITSLKGELYQSYLSLARFQQGIGNQAEANRLFRDARDVLENIPRETPDQLFELATVYTALIPPVGTELKSQDADLAEQQRNAGLAMQALQKAVAAGYSNVAALKSGRSLDPLRERRDFQELLATVEKTAQAQQLASRNAGTGGQKLANRRQAVTLLNELAARQPAEVRHRSTLAATLQSIGEIQTGLKQFADAEKSLREALTLREDLAKQDAKNPQRTLDVLATQIALGIVDWENDRRPHAHRAWQEHLDALHTLAKANLKDQRLQTKIAEQERRITENYGAMAVWDFAAAHVRRNCELKRTTNALWDSRHAVVLPAVGGEDELRDYCQELNDWFRATGAANSANVALHLVWCAGLIDPPAVRTSQLVDWAKRAYDTDSKNYWYVFCQALAQHRSGLHSAALATLESHPTNRDWNSLAGNVSKLSHAFLHALAAHGAGQQELARTQLQQAEKLYRGLCIDELNGGPQRLDKSHWWEFAAGQTLRQEAWQVIEGQTPADPWHHLIQAKGYQQLGERDRANAELAAADAETPNEPDIWILRARLAEGFAERDSAVDAAWQRAVSVAGDDPLPWIQRGRWYAEHGDHQKADADFAKAAALTPNELNKFLEAGWWIVGPYPAELKGFCPPEVDPDPSRPVHVIDPKTGLSDEPVRWRFAATGSLGVDAGSTVGNADATAYAVTYVYSPDERTALLHLMHSGAGIRVWVNSTLVWDADQPAIGGLWDGLAPVVLRQGRNVLLVKCPIATGAKFHVRLGDGPLDRASRSARAGRWEDARREFARVQFGTGDEVFFHRCKHVLLLAALGDADRYQAEVDRLSTQYAQPNNVGAGWWVAWVSSVLPNSAFEKKSEQMLAMADAYRRANPVETNEETSLAIYAIVNYRAGRLKEAVALLEKIPPGHQAAKLSLPLQALLAQHQGKSEEGQQRLLEADEFFDEKLTQLRNSARAESPPLAWLSATRYHAFDFFALYREAAQLIDGNTMRAESRLTELDRLTAALWSARDPLLAAFDDAVCYATGDAKPWLARGQRLAELGRFVEAEADFNKAVKLKPEDAEALAARAGFYADHGEPAKAAADFHAALSLFTGPAKPRWLWGAPIDLEVAQHDEVFENLAALRPESDQWLWAVRAAVLVRSGDLDGAAAAAERLTQYGLWPIRAAVALLCGDHGQFEKLRSSTEHEDGPLFETALLALAPTDRRLNERLLAAAERLKQQAAADDRYAKVWFAVANLRAEKETQAVDELEALMSGPYSASVHPMTQPLLAIAYHRTGDPKLARNWLAKSELSLRWHSSETQADAVRVFGPGNMPTYVWLYALVFYREAKALIDGPEAAAEAFELLAKAAREKQQVARARTDAARKNAVEKAEAALNHAVELAGNDPVPWIHRGRFYATRGQSDKSEADFAQAIRLDPDHPFCRLQRAKQNRTVLAEWDFSRGLSGWRAWHNCNVTTTNGVLLVESTGSDPHFVNTAIRTPASRHELAFYARVQGKMTCEVYWATTLSDYSESQKVAIQLGDSGDQWREYRVTFEPSAELVKLRFDPSNDGNGRLEFGWILLCGHSAQAVH